MFRRRGEKTEPFVLSREQAEALRLETENLSPKEREAFEALVQQAHQDLLEHYGPYIKEPMEDGDVVDRAIAMDAETLDEFHLRGAWSGKVPSDTYFDPDTAQAIGATYPYKGKILVVDSTHRNWDQFTESAKDYFRSRFGEEAERMEKEVTQYRVFAHEIAHLYQGGGLPVWFEEIAARYYGAALLERRYKMRASDVVKGASSDFYQELIDRYGDRVHQLSFGQLSPKKAKDIFREWNTEIEKKCFPSLHGPEKEEEEPDDAPGL